jgi:hypothetical protein
MLVEWEMQIKSTCPNLYDVPMYARITSVNGSPVIGKCEFCGDPIFKDDNYMSDDDGIKWHMDCDNTVLSKLEANEANL